MRIRSNKKGFALMGTVMLCILVVALTTNQSNVVSRYAAAHTSLLSQRASFLANAGYEYIRYIIAVSPQLFNNDGNTTLAAGNFVYRLDDEGNLLITATVGATDYSLVINDFEGTIDLNITFDDVNNRYNIISTGTVAGKSITINIVTNLQGRVISWN